MVVPVIAAGRYMVKNELVEGMVLYFILADERLSQDVQPMSAPTIFEIILSPKSAVMPMIQPVPACTSGTMRILHLLNTSMNSRSLICSLALSLVLSV